MLDDDRTSQMVEVTRVVGYDEAGACQSLERQQLTVFLPCRSEDSVCTRMAPYQGWSFLPDIMAKVTIEFEDGMIPVGHPTPKNCM